LLDAQLLAQVYIELTGGRQIGLGLVTEAPGSVSISLTTLGPATGVVREARSHVASPEELVRHRAFVAKIANPLWERFVDPTSERGAA
jgi:DNA polymerase-3 subunit epsilon